MSPNPLIYLSASCRDQGNSSLVDFEVGEVGVERPKPVSFDAASGIEMAFGYYTDPAKKGNFVCRGVVVAGEYVVVVASDGRQTNFPPSIAHVFRVGQREPVGGATLGYVGSWANVGHQGNMPEVVQVVRDYGGLDLLVMGSLVNRGTWQNNAMFSALELQRGQYPGNYLAAVSAHVLGQPVPFNPNKFGLIPLQLMAFRPVFPKSPSGVNPQVEKIVVTGYEGKGLMVVTASEDVGGTRNYTAAAGFIPLGGADGFIAKGVKPTEPLPMGDPL